MPQILYPGPRDLTHWGRVTHIYVGNLTIIGSDNGLSPGRRQAIIWTSAGILLIGPLGTNFSEILIEILTFSFKEMRLKVSSAKWRPYCLGLNVLSRINPLTLTLQCSLIWYDIAHSTVITETEQTSEFKHTKYIPYLSTRNVYLAKEWISNYIPQQSVGCNYLSMP